LINKPIWQKNAPSKGVKSNNEVIAIATDMKLQGFYLDKENETQLKDYSIAAGISKSEIGADLSIYINYAQGVG